MLPLALPNELFPSLLIKKNIRRLPVMDENFNMIGIVSRANIVQAAVKLRKGTL
jgi:CBS-domain-containing membrane protein